MKIFMSWSGERSKVIATALTDWLKMMIQSAEPWMSDQHLEKGSRSISVITKELEGTNAGIVFLTPENMSDPWINFEAGALSKLGEAKVWTYLYQLDHTQVTGPLSQFQHTKVNRDDTLMMVTAICAIAAPKMDRVTLESAFEALWPKLEDKLKNVPKAKTDAPAKRTVGEIAEENLELTRAIMQRLDRIPVPPTASDWPIMSRFGQPGGGDGFLESLGKLNEKLQPDEETDKLLGKIASAMRNISSLNASLRAGPGVNPGFVLDARGKLAITYSYLDSHLKALRLRNELLYRNAFESLPQSVRDAIAPSPQSDAG